MFDPKKYKAPKMSKSDIFYNSLTETERDQIDRLSKLIANPIHFKLSDTRIAELKEEKSNLILSLKKKYKI